MNFGNKYYSEGGAITREKITSLEDGNIFVDISVTTEIAFPMEILKETFTKEDWIEKRNDIKSLSVEAINAIDEYFDKK